LKKREKERKENEPNNPIIILKWIVSTIEKKISINKNYPFKDYYWVIGCIWIYTFSKIIKRKNYNKNTQLVNIIITYFIYIIHIFLCIIYIYVYNTQKICV